MATLLVGFDSAWTRANSGALVGALLLDDGTFHEFGPPQIVDYPQAQDAILKWQAERVPTSTIILLDQPTIVENPAGQRMCREHCRVYGQPPGWRDAAGQHLPEGNVRQRCADLAVPEHVWRPRESHGAYRRHARDRDLPSADADCAPLDAGRCTPRVACPSTIQSGERPFRSRTGKAFAGWRQVHSVNADSWKSFGGSTTLPRKLRRARAIRTG